MLVSYNWLQEHFKETLPDPKKLADLLTMHAFEVEGIHEEGKDTILDLDILPNRASDCLSHYGVAREIATLLKLEIKLPDEFAIKAVPEIPSSLEIEVEDPLFCRRYIAREISNITVQESPDWIKEKLKAIGQKPISDIVDATNLVMFETGQPLHAFDAEKLAGKKLLVRQALNETFTTLDGKKLELTPDTLVIADEKEPLVIAGVKGGTKAEIDKDTKNIILESANFDPSVVRKSSLRYGIRTDSSKRFENDVPPERASFAMDMVTSLIKALNKKSDTIFAEKKDFYPKRQNTVVIAVSKSMITNILGENITEETLEEIFDRLNFSHEKKDPKSLLLETAPKLIGKPYRYEGLKGSLSDAFFDGSSLIQYLFSSAGIQIPRRAADQCVYGTPKDPENLAPGDVIFSNNALEYTLYKSVDWLPGTEIPAGVDHAGLYLGEGKIIHANPDKKEVVVEDLKTSKLFKKIVGIRTMFSFEEEPYVLKIPPYRLDIRYPEDVAEEIGRIYGYERIPETDLPSVSLSVPIEQDFYIANLIRNIFSELGFSEIYTRSFAKEGERQLENPIAEGSEFLRPTLADSMKKSLDFNAKYAPLLGTETIKLFEIAKVFLKKNEEWKLCIGVTTVKKGNEVSEIFQSVNTKIEEIFGHKDYGTPNAGILEISFEVLKKDFVFEDSYEKVLIHQNVPKPYRKISLYPYLLRDIAVFIPENEKPGIILDVVNEEAKDLLVNSTLFDVFEKTSDDGTKKISYAYHLVFQAEDRTLSDDEVSGIMDKIISRLNEKKDFQVR